MSERWKPGIEEQYCFFDMFFEVCKMTNKDEDYNTSHFAVGNCFKTEAEAKAAVEKVKALLLSLQDNGETLQADMQEKQLPEWVEIGGYVYDDRNGYGKIIRGSVKSCYIVFDGGAGDFIPEDFDEFKQARLRPYNAEEMKALVGKVIEETKTGDVSFVTGFCNSTERIYSGTNTFVADLLLPDFTLDGKACGKLEHLENGEWVE